jgi:branched-chain amino acid transport system permease protein
MTARLSALAPWLAFAVALAAAPRVFPSATALTMMSLMGVMIIFALSYNMLLGQTGLLSFGHAVYYGLGGFVAIHTMNAVIYNKLGVWVPVIPLVGGLAGLAFGVLFGLVSTRRAGIVFSMISLGIGELVSSSSFILRTFFGGEEGITTNRSKLAPFFGHKFGPQLEVYNLIAVWCFLCVLAMYAVTRTPFGRMCNAVRENPERVEFVGYSPRMVRLIAFCFAAFFAGIAGGLAAISFEIMNAQQLGAQQSSLVLLMAYIGGVGSFAGPIVGAVIITFLQIMLSDVTSAWQLYFGLMFIAVVMFAPEGVVGWTMLHLRALRGGAVWRLAPAYAAVGPALAASGAGAIMIIELANRQLAEARSEGSAMRLFGFDLDASTLPPWIVAIALFASGTALVLRLWPRVGDAWGAVNTRLHFRGEG